MGLYSGGLIIFASEILGAYFREGLFSFLFSFSFSFLFFFGGRKGGLLSEFYGIHVLGWLWLCFGYPGSPSANHPLLPSVIFGSIRVIFNMFKINK